MAWYASHQAVTTADKSNDPEWIEITEAQYAEAIDAMMDGKEVTVIEGQMVIRPPAPSADHVWQDGEWVLPPQPEPEPPTPEEIRASMPSLTSRQLRLGLVMNGYALGQVEQAISEIPDPQQKAIAEIEWEYATIFERANPLIDQIGAVLGLTPEQIDDMWMAALEL